MMMMMLTNIAPVELLKRQYLQLTDPQELALPRKDILRLPDIQAQIYDEIFDESNITYAPPERYRFRVLKRLVRALEDAIEDPEEDVGSLPLFIVPRFLLYAIFFSLSLQDKPMSPSLIGPPFL